MIDVVARQNALSAIVERLAATAPARWAWIEAAWEAKDDETSGPSLTWLVNAVLDGGDRWFFGSFAFDTVLYDAVLAFRDACGQDRWTAFEIDVAADHQFFTRLSYDPVPAAGQLDPQRLERMQNLPQRWVAEHGTAPTAGAGAS